MIVSIFVSDMDRATRFYTEVLGCKLDFRFGDEWAQLQSEGTTFGLHPASKESPAGIRGSIQLGIAVSQPIQQVVEELTAKGVRFLGPVRDDTQVLIANFEDHDGNPLYLAEMKQKW